MKQKHVHRGVSSKLPTATVVNNDPVLGVGKLRRIHRTFSKARRRGKSRRDARDKSVYLKYNLRVLFACFTMAFIAGISWMLYQQINRPDDQTAISTLAQDTFVIPHPPAAKCVSMVEEFLASSNASELAKISRLKRLDATEAYPLLVQFRKNLGEVQRIEWMGAEETNGISLERVVVMYKSGSIRIASLVDVGQGDWKVDFESFISHQTKSWDQITGQGSCTAVVRVKVRPDSYYNGYFQNEKEWTCLALNFADQSELVYGYIAPQSPAFLDIVAMLRVSDPADMILVISRDAGMNRMQYEIQRVIAQGWVESDVEFSSRNIKKNPDSEKPAPQ